MAEDTSLDEGSEASVESPVKARWVIPQNLSQMTFIGKDVLAVGHDIYILFLNLKTGVEQVYVANCEDTGDGVDCFTGHRTGMFAFAEKQSKQPRIFVMSYPALFIHQKLEAKDVNRYKGLSLMENELIASFTGFPDYSIAIWNWRSGQRLINVKTGVERRNQIYMASRTSLLVCQCWGLGLRVWEVALCHRACLLLRRGKEEPPRWQLSDPPLLHVCWTTDGQLYAIDDQARLYGVLSDGIGMVTNLEWAEEISGDHRPSICAFGHGMIIYCPDMCLRVLKKADKSWKVSYTYRPSDHVESLVSNAAGDAAAMWTRAGHVYTITGDEDRLNVKLFTYKQRNIKKIQMIAPEYKHLATLNEEGTLAIYEVMSGKLLTVKYIRANDVSFHVSPVDPLLVVFGEVGPNYGISLLTWKNKKFEEVERACITHQIISQVAFSPDGHYMVVAAMAAGHIFIYELTEELKLNLVRYVELGRGLADCFLLPVGGQVRCFSLVLFSDKYSIGERIMVVSAVTGRDNKFAGKMAGPYRRLVGVGAKDLMCAVPHLDTKYHLCQLVGDKGVTINVKIIAYIETGHELKLYDAILNTNALVTFGYDGTVVVRKPHAPKEYDLKITSSHRYETGIRQTLIDSNNSTLVTLGGNQTLAVRQLVATEDPEPCVTMTMTSLMDPSDDENKLFIINKDDKNYLDLQEDKKVHEETIDYYCQREEIIATFKTLQSQVVALIEENIGERKLHQLSLSEFNLHLENKKERMKQAEKEREEIRLGTEARIRAQDAVRAWIKAVCWDTMATPRVKLFAIFSHYQVENYAVLPGQVGSWPALQQAAALAALQPAPAAQLRPWEEPPPDQEDDDMPPVTRSRMDTHSVTSSRSIRDVTSKIESQGFLQAVATEQSLESNPYVLSGSNAHKLVTIPPYAVPQTLAFSFMHMDEHCHVAKLIVQDLRLWFNKQFDELMATKKREVALVIERNDRLRFIIEELNKLSDLRGSFHHLMIQIADPQWRQEEQPEKLIKVEPEECSIEPYISPSQIVIVPPDPGPKDDFRERALMDMMDGVLEKLWHEEIKKPVPMPACMLEKDPEHFNEEDLRWVFDYERKVEFRNQERDKYRKMLHAEYAKLSGVLNEGIVKFNQKVKEMWLTRLKVDSSIGQENLNLLRLRRTNLDRIQHAEQVEEMRSKMSVYDEEVKTLEEELTIIQHQKEICQAALEAATHKDRHMEKTFRNHFGDMSPIVVDQCYKFFRRRPKLSVRTAVTATALLELAAAVSSGVADPNLMMHECYEYFKSLEAMDQITNMPAALDENLWHTTIKLRRAKIDNELRMRALVLESGQTESAAGVWAGGLRARHAAHAHTAHALTQLRDHIELLSRNKSIQLVLPAGQVEILGTGHIEDFEDATLILRSDIDLINECILRVGALKLRMMRRQMEFRKTILTKEWEHAQLAIKIRHMEQELYAYSRLKIPKELQWYLKEKTLGVTEETTYLRMEHSNHATLNTLDKELERAMDEANDMQVKSREVDALCEATDKLISQLNVKVSEKRLREDPLEPIRVRKVQKNRMETLVSRSRLVRQVQANHVTLALLHTELELMRLRTYPTLAALKTVD